jgi:hypothetical protein
MTDDESDRPSRGRRFTVTLSDLGRGRLRISLPFDPDAEWGARERHPVTGTVDRARFRGAVDRADHAPGVTVGSAWLRGRGLAAGDQVEVYLEPEGPQRADLAPDLAAALAASPQAARSFDALAQFYRRGYLRWVDATKRSPETRTQRIAEMVRLLEQGVKDYRRR